MLQCIGNEKLRVLSNDGSEIVHNGLAAYPVGSIYMSVNDIDPSRLFGGTWERYAKGRTLIGLDEEQEEFNVAEKTGGTKENMLEAEDLPLITLIDVGEREENDYQNIFTTTPSVGYKMKPTSKLWDRQTAVNNLQPYITCYMWKRTA